jgi:hypothetical protein
MIGWLLRRMRPEGGELRHDSGRTLIADDPKTGQQPLLTFRLNA